ncbi:MAG TPA: anthranilate phosphoribosyltransferase [Chthoniobacterales bacterium]|nr:anthranilate phosphoribosyltransferase [Chthoniobacterales bacterium]
MSDLLEKLHAGRELDDIDVAGFCTVLFDEARPIELRAELLQALSRKGETPREIASFVRALLGHARKIEMRRDGAPIMDVCGTGGDKHGLFNISTAVMFVVAACGVRVVKHGNRGVTSKSGGADVLEALNVRIELEPTEASAVLDDVGCVFLFAPLYHPSFKAVGPVRGLLAGRGVATVFNKLGPLLNPANPPYQLAGVFDPAMVDVYGTVFAELGRERTWAVHGRTPVGGLDEMSTLGTTDICALEHGSLSRLSLDAADFELPRPELAELVGGGAMENAATLEALLRGKRSGAIEDMVTWNAAGCLVVAGVCSDIGGGLEKAREAIRSGEAAARLDALRAATAGRSNKAQ